MINKTVQSVFDKAIWLMNEQNENTGETLTQDTIEYKVRTIGIINSLLDDIYPADSTFESVAGERPVIDDITDFADVIPLDARLVRDVLPNGLAAKLLAEENPTLANYFQQVYETNLAKAAIQIPREWEDIDNPYGGIENRFY